MTLHEGDDLPVNNQSSVTWGDIFGRPTPVTQFDPTDPVQVKKLIETIEVDFDDAATELYGSEEGFRTRLGFSGIGKSCSRELWYGFHWAKKADLSSKHKTHGQVLRLFNRGHREEPAIRKLLEHKGHRLEPHPTDEMGFPHQHRSKLYANGHMGSEYDDIGMLPERFGFHERVIYEYKTSATSDHTKLVSKGVHVHKPVHYLQMCVAGYDLGIPYAFYTSINKDNDQPHFEFLNLNLELGRDMIMKGESIVNSEIAPPRISQSASSFKCQFCNFKDQCFYGEAVEKNCRSCVNAKPVADGKWFCKRWNATIPKEELAKGCAEHVGLQ